MPEDTFKVRVARGLYFMMGFAMFPLYKALTIYLLSCVIPILIGYSVVVFKNDVDLLRELNKGQNILDFFTFNQNMFPVFMEYFALAIQSALTLVFYFGIL